MVAVDEDNEGLVVEGDEDEDEDDDDGGELIVAIIAAAVVDGLSEPSRPCC